jgi:tetratricopeptide (TPR) repeat protein
MDKQTINKLAAEFTPEKMAAKAQEAEALMKKTGKPFHEVANITPQIENELYVLAKNYYDQGKYEEAVTLFSILCLIHPGQFNFTYGLASSYHQAHDYISAATGFSQAIVQNPSNLMPYYFIGDCYLHLQNYKDASIFFGTAADLVEFLPSPENKIIGERCRLLEKGAKKELSKKNLLKAEKEKQKLKTKATKQIKKK